MPRIYIVGSSGSGKTTLAKKLSKELNIRHYELDNIVWKPSPRSSDVRRSNDEILQLFEWVIKDDNWIVENKGRDIFDKAYDFADTIIYLDVKKEILYFRVLFRWLKQNIGAEYSSYEPSLRILKKMIKCIVREQNEDKFKKLDNYKEKLIILDHKQANNYNYAGRQSC